MPIAIRILLGVISIGIVALGGLLLELAVAAK